MTSLCLSPCLLLCVPGIVAHLIATLAALRPTHHLFTDPSHIPVANATSNPGGRGDIRGGTAAGGGGAADGRGGGGNVVVPPSTLLLSITRRALSLCDSLRRRPLDLALVSGNLGVARALLQRVGHFCFEGVGGATAGQGLAPAQRQGLGSALGSGLGSAQSSVSVVGSSSSSSTSSNGSGVGSTGGSVLHYAVMGRSPPCVHLLVRYTLTHIVLLSSFLSFSLLFLPLFLSSISSSHLCIRHLFGSTLLLSTPLLFIPPFNHYPLYSPSFIHPFFVFSFQVSPKVRAHPRHRSAGGGHGVPG